MGLSTFLYLASSIAQNSPLAQGKWYKMSVIEDAIYKVSYQDFINMGFAAADLNAKTIQLYTNHGGMLPETIDTRPLGLQEMAIEVIDENANTKIDAADYILFYGESPDKWVKNGTSYRHVKNIYSDQSHYFITIGTTDGKRIQSIPSLPSRPSKVYSKSDFLWFHDIDLVNPAHMGRAWGGEEFGLESNQLNLNYTLPQNLNDTAEVIIDVLNVSNVSSSSLKTTVNGIVKTSNLPAINPESYEYLRHTEGFNANISSKSLSVNLNLNKTNNQSHAYLDFIELIGKQDLTNTNGTTLIRSLDAANFNAIEYTLGGLKANSKVWNVINPGTIESLKLNSSGSNGYVNYTNNSTAAKLVLFATSDLKNPFFNGEVANQNVSADDVKELIIIYPKEYKVAAEDLQSYKESKGISTKIITPASIYNEYSTGQQDITGIRDYLRNENLKTGPNGEKLKYVLLLGSTSFDPKDRLENNTNRIPTYISSNYAKTSSFVQDDYYTYAAQGTGIPGYGVNSMNFSIGRVPARTLKEAQIFIAKLKKYESPSSLGPWRTNIAFVSDDMDAGYEIAFHNDSEFAFSKMDAQHPQFEVKKIYMDAYKQFSTGNKEEYPDVERDLNFNVENGCLFMNFIGHGGERGWTQESILDIPTINSWKQPNGNYPIFFTATCEFSRNDDPSIQSGGELTLFNPDGGGIALLSTTRLVWVSGNSAINRSFWDKDGFPSWNDGDKTLGTLYKRLKNRAVKNSEDLKFTLLGDPSMTPNFPKNNVALDSINGTYILSSTDTLKAFSLATLKGHISDKSNSLLSNFNGELWATIYDKPSDLKTLNNDKVVGELPYKLRNSVVYKGKVDVVNGKFTLRFVVPKDIAYNIGAGRIYLYAHNNITDAAGVRDILVGSSIDNNSSDTEGPEVKPYMNAYTFNSGDVVNKKSTILARISDLSGINSTGNGIGRNITAIIDEGTTIEQNFNLNNYFTYDKNSYSEGEARFPVEKLSIGKHTLKIKAWDIYNNLGFGTTTFEVVDDNSIVVSEHSAFPNPFWNGVNFNIKHNYAGQDLDAKLYIMNNLGSMVSETSSTLKNTSHVDSQLSWDGRTISRGEVAPGMYFYKVILTAPTGASTSFSGKIIKKN